MKVPSRLPPRAGLSPSRLAVVLCLSIALLAGCRDREAEAARYARQTRQLRDATRMLDALETSDGTVPTSLSTIVPVDASDGALDLASPYPNDPSAQSRDPRWLLLGLPPAALLLFHFVRRRKRPSMSDTVSLTSLFAGSVPPQVPVARHRPAPVSAATTVAATPVPVEAVPSPVEDASTPPGFFDDHASIHLVGDARHPEIHRIGDVPLPFDAWRERLSRTASTDGADAALASWLLPALLVLQSRSLRRQEAEILLDEAAGLAAEGILGASSDDRPHWIARAIRIELAKIERQSGATRLFALRALQSRQSTDLAGEAPCVLDAWIDVHLAWAGWLLGDGANARYAEAESLCERLADAGGDGAALALKRRAAIVLRQADNPRAASYVDQLDHAQALLGEAHALDDDAHTALLIARTAHRLAVALPPTEAADACSHALMHAFLAEQHPAWRVEALECRLAIQLTYESLPGRTTQGEVVATLERELAAMDAESAGARMAMAAARLREGDFAGASTLCEAAWRSGANDARLFTLWRDACRGWSETAATAGHDREALAQALRQLAVARSTT